MRTLLNGLGWTSTEPIALRRLRRMLEADAHTVPNEEAEPVARDTPQAPTEPNQSLVPRAPIGQGVAHFRTLHTAGGRR